MDVNRNFVQDDDAKDDQFKSSDPIGAATMTEFDDSRIESYLEMAKNRPAEFSGPGDGVRIALDPSEIRSIEAKVGSRYLSRGWPSEWAQVGIAYRDPFFSVLRDAVVFPGGRVAVHHRVLSNSEPAGTAVLPLLDNGIVLIKQFRHPSRRWHWEIPRGGIEMDQTADDAARSELREEIGSEAHDLIDLGRMHGSTAIVSGSVALFAARISGFGEPQTEEGISAVRAFPVTDFERMVTAGEIMDSFTLGAFLKARLLGIV